MECRKLYVNNRMATITSTRGKPCQPLILFWRYTTRFVRPMSIRIFMSLVTKPRYRTNAWLPHPMNLLLLVCVPRTFQISQIKCHIANARQTCKRRTPTIEGIVVESFCCGFNYLLRVPNRLIINCLHNVLLNSRNVSTKNMSEDA